MHNSLTVHDNLWTLKFDKFSEFQNVISDNLSPPPHPRTSLLRTASEKRYVTHALPIFNSYLFNRIKIAPIYAHESSKPISLIKRRIEYLTKVLLRRFSKIMFLLEKVSIQFENDYIYEIECTWSKKKLIRQGLF